MEPSLPSAPPLPHSPPTAGPPWSTVDCPRSTACPPRYRPRQPRASPVWQVVRDHWPAFRAAYPGRYQADWGPLPDRADTAVSAFLRCGDFNAGFTRLRCRDCGHEFLLPFSCKQRGLCAACHQRRALDEAAFIADTVCAPVPHRHLVLTVPRLLRTLFRSRRALLSELCLAARDALTLWLRERTGCPGGRPGIVIAIQTFGDFLFWHPHLHILVAAGLFATDGDFHLAPGGGWAQLRELWRHSVLSRLRACGVLADWHVQRLLAWRNGGFTLDAGPAPVAATDASGRRRIAEYLLRAPFSLEKISYNPANACVLYRSERHWRTGRNFEVFRAHDFLAALIAQLPVKGVPMVRYYGRYANRRPSRAAPPVADPPCALTPRARRPRHRTRWRQLIYRIWGADPLRCPLCNGYLFRHSLVETPKAIRAVLEPLGLYEGPGPPAQAPPAPGAPPLPRSTWADPPVRFASEPASQGDSPSGPDPDLRQAAAEPIVVLDAENGAVHAVGSRPTSRIRSPLAPKTDPWYFRQWYTDETHDFDDAGFEQPPQRWPGKGEAAQLTFFADDEAQSFPPDEDAATRSAAWANFARLRLAPQRPQAQSSDDDFAQPFPPDDLPTLVYD